MWTVIAAGIGHVGMLLVAMTVQILLVLEAGGGAVAGLDGALERAGVRFVMLAGYGEIRWLACLALTVGSRRRELREQDSFR